MAEQLAMDEQAYVCLVEELCFAEIVCCEHVSLLSWICNVTVQDEGLRIAWQYRKYFGDERNSSAEHRGDVLIPPFHLFT